MEKRYQELLEVLKTAKFFSGNPTVQDSEEKNVYTIESARPIDLIVFEAEQAFKYAQPFTDERAVDLLIGAFEGGSNYWIDSIEYNDIFKTEVARLNGLASLIGNVDGIQEPYYASLYLIDKAVRADVMVNTGAEEGEPARYLLNMKSLREGIYLMSEQYPNHYANFINEMDDAETADVALQLALFKEIVYG